MNKSKVTSFPPIVDSSSRVLILGSMPGIASLQANQYYAHARNHFWKIMGSILKFDPMISYDARIAALRDANIAVWDVLESCVRHGSLDSAIQSNSIRANDFCEFFKTYPSITWIYFNGATAERYFRSHVLYKLQDTPLFYQRLPSTSPAHAARSFEEKLQIWTQELTSHT